MPFATVCIPTWGQPRATAYRPASVAPHDGQTRLNFFGDAQVFLNSLNVSRIPMTNYVGTETLMRQRYRKSNFPTPKQRSKIALKHVRLLYAPEH